MLSTSNTESQNNPAPTFLDDNPLQRYSIRDVLLTRHGATDTICITALKEVDGKTIATERFCTGVDEAAALIERGYEREDIKAIWSNLQRLKPGSDKRKKGETIDRYTNLTIDIDRKIKKIHEDGSLCLHDSKEQKTCGAYKCNATDEEVAVLHQIAEKVSGFLVKPFGPCVFAFSGNGWHLNWKLDDIDPVEGQQYYRRLLALLKAKFEQPDFNVEIDASLADDTQVVTCWGTWNRKYPDTLTRPQRQSKVLFMPPKQKPIKFYDLEIFLIENRLSSGDDAPVQAKTHQSEDDYLMADAEWLEEYGVSDLVEYFEKLGYWKSESETFDKGNDTYYPVKPCYCHADEPEGHTHSHANDCCLIEYGDGGVGISCFNRSFGLKTVIKRLNDRAVADGHKKYPHLIFEGAEPRQSDEEIAKENKGAMAALGVQELKPVKGKHPVEETVEPEPSTESTLRYPELLPEFDTICYPGSKLRELVETACMGGALTGNKPFALSPGFVIPAILTLVSALPEEDEMLSTRINLFTCLLSISRAGKDVSWARSGAVMGLGKRGESSYWADYRPGGHSQMIEKLGDTQEKQKRGQPKPPVYPGPTKLCGISPELSEIIKSAKGESSHMLETFQQFFDSNFHTTKDRSTHREVKMKCRFSWGTSLAIGIDRVEEKRFTKVFGDMVNDGFASRFLFGFSETAVNAKDLEEWTCPVADPGAPTEDFEQTLLYRSYAEKLEKHVVTGYEAGVRELYVATEVDYFPGCAYLFKKIMLVIACANLHTKVTTEDFNAALAFMRWQSRLREIFKPSQADDSPQARFQETVLRAIKRMTKQATSKEKWINVPRLAQRNGWAMSASTIGLERTIYALQACGELKLKQKVDADGDRIEYKGRLLWDWERVQAVKS